MRSFFVRCTNLFRREWDSWQEIARDSDEVAGELGQVANQNGEIIRALQRLVVHVKAAIYLNLQRMDVLRGTSVVLGYEPARIGTVQLDRIALGTKQREGQPGEIA